MLWSITLAAMLAADSPKQLTPAVTLGSAPLLADDDVNTVAWSSDGALLVSGGRRGGGLLVWDFETGARTGELVSKRKIVTLLFSPDGKTVAAGDLGAIELWDVASRTLRLVIETSSAHRFAFSPDAKRLAVTGLYGMTVWDATTGKQEHELPRAAEARGPVVFSADGSRLIAALENGGLAEWKGSAAPRVVDPKVMAVSVSLRGSTLALATTSALELRDEKTLAVRTTCKGQKDSLDDVELAADGSIFSVSRDGTARRWTVTGGECAPKLLLDTGSPLWALGLSSRGLAVGGRGRRLQVLKAPDWKPSGGGAPVHADGVRAVAFSTDGKTLLSGDAGGTVAVWNVGERALVRTLPSLKQYISQIAFVPGSTRAVVQAGRSANEWRPDATELTPSLLMGAEVTYSPDGKVAASADDTRIVVLRDASSGAELHQLGAALPHDDVRQNLSTPSSVAFSPDSAKVAIARWDQPLRIFNVATGAKLQELPGTLHVAWSRDGSRLATNVGRVSKRGDKLELLLFDTASWTKVATLPVGSKPVFSPDGATVAALDAGAVLLFDARTGALAAKAFVEGHRPTSFAFSPDGALLATGGDDVTVRLWPLR